MANTIKLEVITPSKLFYKGDVEIVICNTLYGEEGFMANHSRAWKLLGIGPLWIKEPGQSDYKQAAISGGYVDVREGIMIYTDAAEWAADIDVDRAKAVKESAKEVIETARKANIEESDELTQAKTELAKAMTRIKVSANMPRRSK